jgi:hypothetical protein
VSNSGYVYPDLHPVLCRSIDRPCFRAAVMAVQYWCLPLLGTMNQFPSQDEGRVGKQKHTVLFMGSLFALRLLSHHAVGFPFPPPHTKYASLNKVTAPNIL